MTRSAKIEAFLGEGNFEFQLLVGELIELEEGRVAAMARLGQPVAQGSIMAILTRLEEMTALVVEVKAVLRLGLVGAGMGKAEAFNVVERHVRPPDMRAAYLAAYAVLAAAWVGAPGDPPGGAGGGSGEPEGRAKASSSPTAPRAGAGSSRSAAGSSTRRKSSRAAASGS